MRLNALNERRGGSLAAPNDGSAARGISDPPADDDVANAEVPRRAEKLGSVKRAAETEGGHDARNAARAARKMQGERFIDEGTRVRCGRAECARLLLNLSRG